MTRALLAVSVLLIGALALVSGQTQEGTPFRIEKLDPSLDEIIDASAPIETLGDRFGLTEGPVWVEEGQSGYLLFSDNAANVIYKWERNKPLSVFLEKSGYTGNDVTHAGAQTVAGRLAILLIGSNGLALDPGRATGRDSDDRPDRFSAREKRNTHHSGRSIRRQTIQRP
jgi:hypothetical protein